ncbi:hypothetical protein [uncultured Paraglaciecola sp.]|uniref:hypothetical protein n=1 Tax=uncultured Paraglaciecola sp. TaxID=1765024 RepID=UPI002625C501|nr:hypothetical protein [uncultured Paraglaciecola sp.]
MTGEGIGYYLIYLNGYRWPDTKLVSSSHECRAVRGIDRARKLINDPEAHGAIPIETEHGETGDVCENSN